MVRVLVVDDERTVCEVLSKSLKEWGYQVATASDGDEALERTESEEFDLVVSDSVMPRMIGSEFCKRLKQNESTKDIPVIMIGAVEGDEAKAYDAGAVSYMDKPFRLTDLQARLSKALSK